MLRRYPHAGYLQIVSRAVIKGSIGEDETVIKSIRIPRYKLNSLLYLTIETRKGDVETVRLLLKNNADPNITNGRTRLLEMAQKSNTPAVVRVLIDAGAT